VRTRSPSWFGEGDEKIYINGEEKASIWGTGTEDYFLSAWGLYSKEILSREYHLLDFWPEPGKYTLRLECVGKSPESAGHYLGIESVRLRQRRPRVLEYARDKDKDWRKEPILYE